MRRRVLSWWWAVSVLAGCWADEPRVDGFTADQWSAIQKQYSLEPTITVTCPGIPSFATCSDAADLGQRLFFEPALSSTGQVACVTCHDPKGWFIDTRAANAVSMGATKFTGHNTISVVNLALKPNFTWSGKCQDRPCTSPQLVITDIALPKAMASTPTIVTDVIRNNPEYAAGYAKVFGSDDNVVPNVASAMTAYALRLLSLDAPFDSYIKGNASALSDSARRGFTLFVGKAMCAECHSGALFTDAKVHVTGVSQSGENAPLSDPGYGTTGGFFTPPLRQVEKTGPYMHDGSLATLADVVEFYRRGGDSGGYTGEKDALMQPLDLTDDEAKDLEAFLRALTGQPVAADLTTDLRNLTCSGSMCGGQCVDLGSDPQNCGSCGRTCMPGEVCTSSGCVPPPQMCPPPSMLCGQQCLDVTTDPMNCGTCGLVCPSIKPVCTGGVCGH